MAAAMPEEPSPRGPRTLESVEPPRQVSLAKGTKLGAYEVLAPLGAGGMGEVYRHETTSSNGTSR
jgi:serine/threonine-protein kinase